MIGTGSSCRKPLRASVRETTSYWSRSTERGSEGSEKCYRLCIKYRDGSLLRDKHGFVTELAYTGHRSINISHWMVERPKHFRKDKGIAISFTFRPNLNPDSTTL